MQLTGTAERSEAVWRFWSDEAMSLSAVAAGLPGIQAVPPGLQIYKVWLRTGQHCDFQWALVREGAVAWRSSLLQGPLAV